MRLMLQADYSLIEGIKFVPQYGILLKTSETAETL